MKGHLHHHRDQSLSGIALMATMPCLSGCAIGEVAAARIALVSDTASITAMEIVDNLIMLMIPGAMNAPLDSLLCWGGLAIALVIVGVAAFSVNRWLIAPGQSHAIAHGYH